MFFEIKYKFTFSDQKYLVCLEEGLEVPQQEYKEKDSIANLSHLE